MGRNDRTDNFHSFNPATEKSDEFVNINESNAHEKNMQQYVLSEKVQTQHGQIKMEDDKEHHAISFESKNLFKIDDLYKNDHPNKSNNRSYNIPAKSDWPRKVYCNKLPKVDNRKNKEIMKGVKGYDLAKISVDSPIRVIRNKKKSKL